MDLEGSLLLGFIALVSFTLSFYGAAVGLVLGHLRLPLLIYYLGSAAAGTATNLAISGLGALTGTVRHVLAGRVSLRVLALMGIPSMAGAYLGSLLLIECDSTWSRMVIGGFLAFTGFNMIRVKAATEEKEVHVLGPFRLVLEVVIGLGLGFLASVTGLMLGSMRLPMMIRVLKIDPRVAVGTNMAIGCVTAFVGAATALSRGGGTGLPLLPLCLIGPPTILGGLLGARMVGRIRKETLQGMVGWTIAVVGLFMVGEGLWKTLSY
jgi:uncharacterized membrane protein YfcA